MARGIRSRRRISVPVAESARKVLVPTAPAMSGRSNALEEIDRRIASAQVQDLPMLVEVRGSIIEQDEVKLGGLQTRKERMATFYSKIGFSVVAAVGGGALIASNFVLPGFFLLGGAAAIYVPGYVKDVVGRLTAGDGNAA